MPQDIQTKDGIILRGIPDGTPDDVIKARIEQIRGGKSSPKFTGDADPAATEAQAISGATPAQLIAGSAPARFAMGAASPLMGLLQLGAHTSGTLLDKGAGAVGLEKPNLAGKMDELVQNAERLKKEGMAAYGDKGFDAIGLGGAVMNPVGLTVGKALPAAATLLGKVGQGAGIGAVGGASSPVTDSGDFAEKKAIQTGAGAVVGGAVPVVVAGAKVPLKAAYNLVEPFLPGGAERIGGRMANAAAGDRRQEVVDALTQNKQLVPGSQGTAGEVAAPAGSAEFSALQKVAATKTPSDYNAIRLAQDAARLSSIQQVGGDKEQLANAVAERALRGRAGYGSIEDKLVNPQSDTQILEQKIAEKMGSKVSALRDQGQMATQAAENASREVNFTPVAGQPRFPGRYSEFPERIAEAQAGASDAGKIAIQRQAEKQFLEYQLGALKQTVGESDKALTPLLSRPSMRAALQDAIASAEESGKKFPTDGKLSVGNLQRIKESLDAGIEAAKRATDAGKRPELSPRELTNTRDAFVSWLENKVPAWAEARAQYAKDSLPINQMQVGQYLENKLVPALNDAGAAGAQRSAVFAQAVRDAPGTLKRATGEARYDDLAKILTEQQMSRVSGVGADLARKADYENLAKQGMPAAQDQLGKQVEGIKGLNLLDRTATIVRAIVNRMEGKGGEKAIGELSLIMQDPQKMAKVMENALPSERAKIVDAMMQRQMSNAGAVAATRQ